MTKSSEINTQSKQKIHTKKLIWNSQIEENENK